MRASAHAEGSRPLSDRELSMTPAAGSRMARPVDWTANEESAMSMDADDAAGSAKRAPLANVDRMSQSANAILACGESLATTKEMPSDQREAVDMLRREIRTLVYGLSVLTAVQSRSHRVE